LKIFFKEIFYSIQKRIITMQISRIIFISLLFCAALFCAGCTQSSPSDTVSPDTVSAPVADPAQMGLTLSDLPPGFALAESRTKNTSEMGRLALDLGWQSGYLVRYISPVQNGNAGTEIIHSIAIYPEQTIPDVIEYSAQQAKSDSGFTYTNLTVHALYEHAQAFSGKAGAQIPTTSTGYNLLSAKTDAQVEQTELKNDFSEIFFSKGNTFEVIKISGPSPDTAFLLNLSEKAYAKIP
jgi:hypothetical protein